MFNEDFYIEGNMDLNMDADTLTDFFSSETDVVSTDSIAPPLDPKTIPKFVNQLVVPPVYAPIIIKDPKHCGIEEHFYIVFASQFQQQILPSEFPKTTVWGYGGLVKDPATGGVMLFRNAPGATFETIRGIKIHVQWLNCITTPHFLPVDPTLHWADPNNIGMPQPPFNPFPPGYPRAQKPVPIVMHLHGGETEPASDGHPDAWFTAGEVKRGPTFIKSLYTYNNTQESTTLWYHDHALGITRLNVVTGLAGFYLLRDPENPLDKPDSILPKGNYEIPLVIQDRSFKTDGSLAFPNVGVNPGIHPYWFPEFFGDTIIVNGKTWPNLDVERRQYRFRLLNGSNARFYTLRFSNRMSFTQIGSDGGYLPQPVILNELTIAPGERADLLVDFSSIDPGTSIILTNHANAPFPDGDPPDPETVGQIMQFTVLSGEPVPPPKLPSKLNKIPTLKPNAPKRTLPLFEVMGPEGPILVTLNGQKWAAPVSELPRVGSTEIWELVNLTGDAHPIHLHLVQFQVLNRQQFDVEKYTSDWITLNGEPPFMSTPAVLPVKPYLQGKPISPPANEKGWKDTIQALPGEITRITVRFAPQDAPPDTKPGMNLYPFNPTVKPGYVWHCHILDHEDNEMMRPYKVTT